jgi:hypothetical protein
VVNTTSHNNIYAENNGEEQGKSIHPSRLFPGWMIVLKSKIGGF